ncbi:MAG: hypothetical protein US30_C0001G0116 [Candidatus Moranbacteria bacterium GW2011_GWF2_36_839]|nr:MAG: hypothetical protein US27_C0001G0116 [Candidatus Moranbacteria bacterium GW2011_GWF1_36_78]KKQ17782.1 MAG: hypothetical protein US30_C0001G0116 [Candidatus Moranbacteria bacterium GW2011_GWF2_36_839]HAT73484.1 hypothetical protein [Candidatus Moranbacteria bacterium]HBY10846.1 hypothetical protein [Candidatus Moranbacteria bacterium]
MIPIAFLRQFRLGDYAIFDFAVSLLGFYLLSPLLSKIFLKLRIDIPRQNWLYLTLPIGVATHLIFGKITPLTRDFIDIQGHYIVKIVIIALLLIGLNDIKIVKKKI